MLNIDLQRPKLWLIESIFSKLGWNEQYQNNYYSSEKISNKDPSLTKYTFLQVAYQSYHSSFREHSSRPIFTGIFNREKDSQKGRGENSGPRRTAIDVKMINDARLINIILNSMPLEIAPHTLLSFKNNVKVVFFFRGMK